MVTITTTMRRRCGVVRVLLLHCLIINIIDALGIGNCPRHDIIVDFNVTRFTGRWYEVERSFYLMELLSTCTIIDLEANPRGQLMVGITSRSRWSGLDKEYDGVATVSRRGPSAFTFRTNSKLPNVLAKHLPGVGLYQVLITDYDNYAIIWKCSNAFVGYNDLVWIFGRERDFSAALRMEIYDLLKQKNVDPDRFTLSYRNCTE